MMKPPLLLKKQTLKFLWKKSKHQFLGHLRLCVHWFVGLLLSGKARNGTEILVGDPSTLDVIPPLWINHSPQSTGGRKTPQVGNCCTGQLWPFGALYAQRHLAPVQIFEIPIMQNQGLETETFVHLTLMKITRGFLLFILTRNTPPSNIKTPQIANLPQIMH